MVLSRGMEEGKEIPWFLTESKKAWQKASALPKSENVVDMKRGQFFIQVKSVEWKKDGEQWHSSDGIKHFSVCFLKRRNVISKVSSTTMMKSAARKHRGKLTILEQILWICGTDCIWISPFDSSELFPSSWNSFSEKPLGLWDSHSDNDCMEINWNSICE